MADRIVLNTISYHGKGAIGEHRPGADRAAASTRRSSAPDAGPVEVRRGAESHRPAGQATGIAYDIYTDIKPNPTIENVQTGVAAFKASGADCIVAIGGGSSMDTAKAIGIIANNPEFAGRAHPWRASRPPRTTPCSPSPCPPPPAPPRRSPSTTSSPTWRKNRKFVCVDTARHPRSRRDRSRHDGHHAQGPHRRHRHGRADPRHRGLHHQGRLGDDRHVPPEGHRAHLQVPARRRGQRRPEGREGMALGQYIAGMGFSNVGLGIVHSMAHSLARRV